MLMRLALRAIDHLEQLMSSNDRIVVLTILSLSNLIDKDSLATKEFCVRLLGLFNTHALGDLANSISNIWS